jgi:ABC-type lipoprotein release transport system permease subunit
VGPTDTTTFVVAAGTITAVAAVASWLPAWLASRVDPIVTLRYE